MPSALALSPHLDDAAFSAGGALSRLAASGWSVTVATVFTATVPDPTGFALACQLDKGLDAAADYMAIRRDEDAAACAALGARALWLPLREAPHRGYGSAPELFAAPRDDDDADRQVARVLAPLLDPLPDLILAPQAVGGHVDHVALVRALDRLRPAAPVLWWLDWPYAARPHSHPARPFADRFDALPERAIDFDPGRKRDACAAYRSQLGFQFGGTDGLDAALALAGSSERFRAEGATPTLPA